MKKVLLFCVISACMAVMSMSSVKSHILPYLNENEIESLTESECPLNNENGAYCEYNPNHDCIMYLNGFPLAGCTNHSKK